VSLAHDSDTVADAIASATKGSLAIFRPNRSER
jgi:hypothetical protein